MKKILLGVAAAAMTLASGAAMAQPYGYDQDRGAAYRDRDRDGRSDQYDRYDNRRGHSYRGNGRWRQGQVYPYWRDRGYYVSDYRAYNLPPPPRAGYRYYRSDNGDVVMAAIASGMIGAIIGGALNDNDHDRYRHDYRR